MKRYWHAFLMCQSMFCAIPCPFQIWDEDARPLMLLALPVVGLEMGLVWAAMAWVLRSLSVPSLMAGVLLCAFPYLISGFIHLDGFLDVCDTIGSCRSLERRREILKDSHVGAFAVIGCCLLILSSFACCASAKADGRILIFIPVVSRCCSALAVTVLRPMATSQYAGTFQDGISKIQPAVLLIILSAAIAAGIVVCGSCALALLGGLLGYGTALKKGFSSLDGMNGDISGFSLTISELSALAVWAMM